MILPKNIEEIFYQAKKHYPELDNVSIKIKYKPLVFETMRANPTILSFFIPIKRKYLVYINSSKKIKKYSVPFDLFNSSIALGWLGHELAHLVQYEKMNCVQLFLFPFKYFFSKNFRKKFENEANQITNNRGLCDELTQGIDFLLNDSKTSLAYKNRIKKYYK